MPTLLVIGDSVMWGQGLLPANKLDNAVFAYLKTQGADIKVNLAHSGAVIGSGIHENTPSIPGEVPENFPSILRQVEMFTDDPGDVSWVILNGGINDVSIKTILSPFTDDYTLAKIIQRDCGDAMIELLEKVSAKFKKATILAVGYYPILSNQSDPTGVNTMISLFHGVTFNPWVRTDLILDTVVEHCIQFWNQSRNAHIVAVDKVNSDVNGARIKYVDPCFKENNSVYAPDSWLFGLDPLLEPVDQVVDSRHQQCIDCEDNLLLREICFRASAGHPNAKGVAAIATACKTALP